MSRAPRQFLSGRATKIAQTHGVYDCCESQIGCAPFCYSWVGSNGASLAQRTHTPCVDLAQDEVCDPTLIALCFGTVSP